MNQGAGAAALFNEAVGKASLLRIFAIGTVDVKALQLAIRIVRKNAVIQFVICTDSLSAIELLQKLQGRIELTDIVHESLSFFIYL